MCACVSLAFRFLSSFVVRPVFLLMVWSRTVSSLPLRLQALTVCSIVVGTVLLTRYLTLRYCSWLFYLSYPFALVHLISGVFHIVKASLFASVFPPRGTWGLWYLPGSPVFHVRWSGVAEIMGALGVFLGGLDVLPKWILPAAAIGSCLLSAVIFPANVSQCSPRQMKKNT